MAAVSLRSLALLYGLCAITSWGIAQPSPWKPVIIAHASGYAEFGPENTLKALRGSIQSGIVDYIEVDVRLTKDGVPIAIHDETLDRTTDGTGLVSQHTLAEIKQLDAGQGEAVPTLLEVLELSIPNNMGIVLEIKEGRAIQPSVDLLKSYLSRNSNLPPNPEIEPNIYVRHRIMTVFWSVDDIKALHEIEPLLPSSLILQPDPARPFDYNDRIKQIADLFPSREVMIGVNIEYRYLTPQTLDLAHSLGLRVGVGWPTDFDEIKKALRWRPDAIATGFPSHVTRASHP